MHGFFMYLYLDEVYNTHAEKSIHLKILEWTSMVYRYSIDWISICVFPINGKFGMDIAWTLQPAFPTRLYCMLFVTRLG